MPNDFELTHRINYLISEGYKSINLSITKSIAKRRHECIEKNRTNSIQNIDLMLDLAVPKNPNHSLELLEFIKKNNTNIYWIEEPYDRM